MTITAFLSTYSIIAPLLVGLLCFKSMPPYCRILWYMVIAASVAQVASAVDVPDTFTMTCYNLYIIAELYFMVRFFNHFLQGNMRYILLRNISLVLIAAMYMVSLARLNFFDVLFGKTICLLFMFETAAVLLLIRTQLVSDSFVVSRYNPLIYLVGGIMLYSPLNFIFLSFRELDEYVDATLKHPVKVFHDLTNTTMYLLYAIGFYISTIHAGKTMAPYHARQVQF